MTAVASELVALVKTMCGGENSDMLIQLTNIDNSATTINSTVLTSAANMAIGAFRVRARIEPDTTTPNYSHISLLFEGVMYFLENAKSRDVAFTQERGRNFFIGCEKMAQGAYFPAVSSSNLAPTAVQPNTLPDMDISRIAFKNRRGGSYNGGREFNNDS